MNLKDIKLGIIGLGYVGLPLAVEFGRKRSVAGFDINQSRIDDLTQGNDFTLETTQEELAEATQLSYTNDINDLRHCNCYIITVPTPINEHKQPDLKPLIKASESIGRYYSQGISSYMNPQSTLAVQKKIVCLCWKKILALYLIRIFIAATALSE